jgi:hypothetical protein
MNFQQTGVIHQNATRVLEDGLSVKMVDFPELAAFDEARRALADSVKNHALEGPWIQLVELFRFVHACLARSPCRPSWLFEQQKFSMLERLQLQLDARLGSVDPSVRSAFRRAQDAIRLLTCVETNPVAAGAGSLLSTFKSWSRSIVVVNDTRVWDECRTQLSRHCPGLKFEGSEFAICKPIELRDHPAVNELILFGPPWLLKYRNESFLLGSPVAPSIWFVVCRHEHIGVVPRSFFEEGSTYRVNGADDFSPATETNLEHESVALFQPRAFILKHEQDSSLLRVADSNETTRAFPLVLGGAKGIYVQEEGALYIANIRVEGEKRLCLAVERVEASEIEPGMLVLLTTEGGGDLIPLEADKLLKDEAKPIRELEATWKQGLRRQVDLLGVARVAERLGTNVQNVRNWCNPRNIAPEKLEEHLHSILELAHLKHLYPQIVEAIGKLRSAHQSAGMRLQAQLLKSLRDLDLRHAYLDGFQEIRDKAEGPAKTVYWVQDIKGVEQVSTRLLGRVLDLEEEAW